MPLPSNLQTFFLGGLFALSTLTAIYIARAIILPLVLAFVLKLLLQPAVRVLERVRIPRAIGALLPILLVIGVLVGLVAALSGPAATWAKRLPEGIPRLEAHLVVLKEPIQALQRVVQQAEEATDTPGQKGSTIAVRQELGLTGALFSGTRAVLDGLLTTVLVLYFLMVSGDTFLRRMVEILNFIPILGPLFGTVIFLLVGMLTFDSLWWALLPPALYFGIHLIEGETLTPMLLARRFTLNPVLVILSLVFWFWMWGAPGAILAVPMLAIVKIICDRMRPLKALGHFLEG